MKAGPLKILLIFIVICAAYSAWMTGFTFVFSECTLFPNYNMLAKALLKGQLFIDEAPPVDASMVHGKRYLYVGPVPALFHIPSLLLFNRSTPTGLVIAILCAGISVLLVMILKELTPPNEMRKLRGIRLCFVGAFVLSGFSLLMVTIPSIHHEAICSAAFFLTVAIYLLIRARDRGYRISTVAALFGALALSLCIGSRFSYVISAAVVGSILIGGMIRNSDRIPTSEIIRTGVLGLGLTMLMVGLLLYYNHARFGTYGEFGVKYLTSIYTEYFARGHFLRYDHVPYNLWSMFWRIPQLAPEFPFLMLPAFILKVQSIGLMPYFLINVNELSASVFCLMPIMLLAVVPLLASWRNPNVCRLTTYFILSVLFGVQCLTISLTPASTARYYYDFLPIMMMMSYIGALWFQKRASRPNVMIASLAVISVVLSFALPMNALTLYAHFISYKSPLLQVFPVPVVEGARRV
ncbi:MAG: hypothetical protein P8182_06075 [Deltaproteobacteria bacterium]